MLTINSSNNHFQIIPEDYLLINPSLGIEDVTDQFTKSIGHSRELLLGNSFWKVFESHDNNSSYISALLNKNSSTFYVQLIDKKNPNAGTIFTVITQPILNEDNELTMVMCKFLKRKDSLNHTNNQYQTELLNKISDSFPGIIALYNCINGDYLYINKSVEKTLGYTSEELIQGGAPFIFALIHPDDVPELMEKNSALIQLANTLYPNYDDSQVITFEYRLRAKDGSYKWLHTHAIIFGRTSNHQAELLLNLSIDITEQKENELSVRTSESKLRIVQSILEEKILHGKEELLKREAYYHFMAEAIPGIFWTAKADGAVDFYSNRFTNYTGLPVELALKGAWPTIIHPDDQKRTLSAVTLSVEHGTVYEVEHRLKGKDGIYRWFISRAIPLKSENGTVMKWFGTSLNIDEEKKAINLLQENEIKYKFLVDVIPQIIWITDSEVGITEYLNKNWYDYTGMDYNNLDNDTIIACVHPDDLQRITNNFLIAMQTGKNFSHEFRIRNKNGEYRWFLCNGMPMRNNEGKIIKYFATSTDIQYQKEIINNLAETQKGLNIINQELNSKNEELNKINIDLDNFIYTASHDLKAPISNIEGLINFLKKDELYYKDDVKEILDLMVESTERFKKTIAGLTEVAKIQKNTIDDIEEINFEDILQEILKDINEVKSAGAIIKTDFKEQPYLNFSKKYIRSILYNLTSNAIKYRAPYRQPKIEIKTMADEHHAILIVRDNGLGFPQNSKDNVFKMFKRLHTHVEGTGIGLYIVKRIIDNAGGRIEIESEVNMGTTFKIYFKK